MGGGGGSGGGGGRGWTGMKELIAGQVVVVCSCCEFSYMFAFPLRIKGRLRSVILALVELY